MSLKSYTLQIEATDPIDPHMAHRPKVVDEKTIGKSTLAKYTPWNPNETPTLAIQLKTKSAIFDYLLLMRIPVDPTRLIAKDTI